MPESFTVFGAHGTVECDRDTGVARSKTPCPTGCCDGYEFHRIDVREYQKKFGAKPEGEVDILNVGYWYKKDGLTRFEPPVPAFTIDIQTMRHVALPERVEHEARHLSEEAV
jgi:hypothetical protein